ncbi:MAG: hypothetical protein GY749_32680 [Desulfobacteraceae bacterium]|nr:hypothetical protein [Desulfobacteraceae bacterium]
MRYFLEISKAGKHYTVSIHQGDPDKARTFPDASLGPEAEITIKNNNFKLGDLIHALITYNPNDLELAFDERGQLQTGHYLYSQTIGRLNPSELEQLHNENETEIRIITHDEHIARIPWVLLAHRGIFLCTTSWSVALSTRKQATDVELPPSPRILVIAPQPANIAKTHAGIHLENLENLLSAKDHLLSLGKNLRLALTWEEFTELAKTFKPQIIYYYGHGEGDANNARLLFASNEKNKLAEKPFTDFALCLRNMEKPPHLAYINCCQGDTAGFLSAGMQLGDFIPAVITNRTIAKIDAAQSQAMALWEDILLKGIAPHRAVADLYSRITDLDFSTTDVRWMTPVIHCHYDKWKANPPKPPDRIIHDPYWRFKIDRVTQFSTVATQTRQMLRERKPQSLAFVWYGQQGQGMETFHQRLNIELREDLANTHVYEVRPEWPADLLTPHRSFSDMLTEVFEVSSLEDIPARIRSKTYGAFGKQTLVYVRHQPVKSAKLINPKSLKIYLEWWDSVFAPLLESNQFGLLGISFIVKNPSKFQSIILEKEQIEYLDLNKTVFRLLDEMEKIARRDLLDFIRTHNIRLPIKRRDQVLESILEKTGGIYEKTVKELENLVEQAWDFSEEDEQAEESEEEYDY